MNTIESVIHNWKNIQKNAVIIDTETTGLDKLSELVEISIIDARGTVLFDSLIKPINEIPVEARKIHGITDREVLSAPSWAEVYTQVRHICHQRNVVFYNRSFDQRILDQSSLFHDLDITKHWDTKWLCAMNSYSDFKQTPRNEGTGYKRHSLVNAANQLNLEIPKKLHRALPDAQLTLAVINEAYNQLAGTKS